MSSNPPTDGIHLAEEFLDRSTRASRARDILLRYPALSPAIVLLIAVIIFGLLNDRFLELNNLSLIAQQVAIVGTVAAAQTIIILTAGIDLSVGAAMVFASMVMAQLASAEGGLPAVIALFIGFVVAMATGAFNGVLVTRLKLPPFIATLGTLNIFVALTLLYSGGQTIIGPDLPALLTWTGESIQLGGVRVTTGVLIMIVVYIALAFLLGRTAWGRHVYAVGDDKDAARLAGIRVDRVLMSVYIAAGAILAIAAWLQIGRSNAAGPNAAADINLDSITAVVIGGTSLFGGRGIIWGTLLGALIVGVFRNGLSLAGVDTLYQTLAVGVLVIAAVSVDHWIRKAK
ncbi:MAG TPA: ABC transporter permease [Microcella sp.]|nr:ABC transporter permease [Microcella sp.]